MKFLYLLLAFLHILLVTSFPLGDGSLSTLLKRKGGGGGSRGGGGGGGGSSSSSSSGSSGGKPSSSGSSSSGSSSSGSRPASSSGSGSGSTVKPGTIVRGPTYGGYYGGGAALPYLAGGRSSRGLYPYALLPVAGLAFFPGLWLHPAYVYRYSQPYTFYNTTSGKNETEPVLCLCEQWSECGCDDNPDPTYMNSVVGTGNTSTWNATLVTEAVVNGTESIVVNGTLPNGTYTAANGTTITAGAGGLTSRPYMVGWCGLIAAVFVMI